jgi:hypothetical protein
MSRVSLTDAEVLAPSDVLDWWIPSRAHPERMRTLLETVAWAARSRTPTASRSSARLVMASLAHGSGLIRCTGSHGFVGAQRRQETRS